MSSFEEYKKMHVLFSNEKSQISLEIKTNPKDEMDVKIKLKILHEFDIKEFNDAFLVEIPEEKGDNK